MPAAKQDIQPDISADRNEQIPLMEPLLLSDDAKSRAGLFDLALDLTAKSSGFCRSLPATILASLADLVRSMNCYYSNLIEGHDTHPVDIERALKNDYSQNPAKRDLQLEAKSHIAVQRWIDEGGLKRSQTYTAEGICEMHRRFCADLPEHLLSVIDPATHQHLRLIPGQLRRNDVKAGNHKALSPGALPRFLSRFEEVYSTLGKTESIIAVAAAHHRLLWMHPFLDGNGRVARLLSHAAMLQMLDTGSVWSVARGLARNVQVYKELLSNCDLPRNSDLDGRGHLSESALSKFTQFFLKICIDQVEFMESLVQPGKLRARILQWTQIEIQTGALPPKSDALLDALLYRGELPRGDAGAILGTGERQARRIVSTLIDRQVLRSETPRSPLTLNFPATLAGSWMPGLFPEAPSDSA